MWFLFLLAGTGVDAESFCEVLGRKGSLDVPRLGAWFLLQCHVRLGKVWPNPGPWQVSFRSALFYLRGKDFVQNETFWVGETGVFRGRLVSWGGIDGDFAVAFPRVGRGLGLSLMDGFSPDSCVAADCQLSTCQSRN